MVIPDSFRLVLGISRTFPQMFVLSRPFSHLIQTSHDNNIYFSVKSESREYELGFFLTAYLAHKSNSLALKARGPSSWAKSDCLWNVRSPSWLDRFTMFLIFHLSHDPKFRICWAGFSKIHIRSFEIWDNRGEPASGNKPDSSTKNPGVLYLAKSSLRRMQHLKRYVKFDQTIVIPLDYWILAGCDRDLSWFLSQWDILNSPAV